MRFLLKKYLLLFFAVFNILFMACTSETEYLPEESKYREDSMLLIKTSEKLSNESDADKLHTVALAMQTNRTLSCEDFNQECSLFDRFLSSAISLSAKGNLTDADHKELREQAVKIRLAFEEGKSKLSEKWARKNNK